MADTSPFIERVTPLVADETRPFQSSFAELLVEIKAEGAQRVRVTFRSNGIQNHEIFKATHLSRSYISKFMNSGWDSIKPGALEAVADNFMKMSVNEIYFCEAKSLRLPRYLCEYVSCVMELPEARRERLCTYIRSKYGRLLDNYDSFIEDDYAFAIQRMKEYAASRGLNSIEKIFESRYAFLDTDYPSTTPQVLLENCSKLRFLYDSRTTKVATSIGLTQLMAVSAYLDVPLDYMVCKDYTKYNELYYFDTQKASPAEWIQLTDKHALFALQSYLRLPEKEQTELFAFVVMNKAKKLKI